MCKAGKIDEAYGLAKADLEASPTDYWAQTAMGWVLYYKLKEAVAKADFKAVCQNLYELGNPTSLVDNDGAEVLLESLAWQVGKSFKACKIEANRFESLFCALSCLKFKPSKGYSYLLHEALGVENFGSFVDFIRWWNLDNFQKEDYEPYKMAGNRQVMSLAERAYIAYAKALLKDGSKEWILEFIPKVEQLMERHPEMTYPGYFCGKLMMATGSTRDEVLSAVVPFVRRKKSEFWAWQLMSEVYADDAQRRLACLLRAVHCRTKEDFLGKVRLALAAIYLKQGDAARAKHQLQTVGRHYSSKGWNLPREAVDMGHDSRLAAVVADATDGLDYLRITDPLLDVGAQQSLAVVVYVNEKAKRAVLVYGCKKIVAVRLSELPFKVEFGSVMKLSWLPAANDKISVVAAELLDEDTDVNIVTLGNLKTDYLRTINGKVRRRQGQTFAFINNCYMPPALVEEGSLADGEEWTILAVLNFNKRKAEWTWQCARLLGKTILKA